MSVLNTIFGNDENNELSGTEADDLLFGDLGSDTITGGAGIDILAYAGDPFEGQDVSDPERQIIAEEDFITDFNFTEDKYRFNPDDFGVVEDVNFVAVDANSSDASIAPGTNVVTLLNSDNDDNPETPFIAGTAANEIAELTSEDGAGFFVYYNSDLELNRLVYSSNLNDSAADLKVISRQSDLTGQDAIDALNDFSVDNFEFEAAQIDGDEAAENTVYRYFNPNTGVHFYTNDEAERESVGSLDNYVPEGESYVAVDPMTDSAEEVYRFFNENTGVHLYTTSEAERDNIQNNSDSFSFEGTAFYAFEEQVAGSIPIYRFYEPTIGVHFYTPNEEERMSVEENLPNYNSEGIAYYASPIEGSEM